MRLRSKMLLGIGAPFVLIFFAMAVFVYWNASRLIERETQREMAALADFHAEELRCLVDGQRGLVDGLTQAWAMKVPTNEDFLAVARDFAKRQDIDSLYLGFPARDFLFSREGVVPRSRFDATTRSWYKSAVQNDGVQISELYIDAFQNAKVVALSKALKVNGRIEGVLGVDVLFANVEKKVASFKVRETGAAFLLDEAGRFIYHSDLTIDDNVHAQGEEAARRFLAKEPHFFEGSYMGTAYYYAVHPVGGTGWNLVLFVPKAEVLADIADLKWAMIGGSIVSLTLLGVLLFLMAQSIAGPMENVNRVAMEVAKGNLSIELRPTDRTDEIGSLHNSFCTMADGLKKLIATTVETAEQLAASSEELTASADQSARGAQHTAEAITKITGDTVEQDAVVESP